ncbi:hypothetical protein AURDEDRAFT_155971 [Auricularia subglabra TFB-10046 SS5]|nr:hypothetical protein AURDEDRAFT_155971 [Auricularia subglabra TFB-10046 SS5]
MNAPVFQDHLGSQPPRSPHKLRSRTGRLAAQQLDQGHASPAPKSPLPPLPRPPSMFFPAPPPYSPRRSSFERPVNPEPPSPLILQILSHPRLPLVLLLPLALLLAYTLHILVHGLVHSRHLTQEKPWTAVARIVEARAREAQWNSVAAVARVFGGPQEQAGLGAQVARWMGFA